jgi:short subunit dehydrogenase-like uncharacterized protein
VSEASHDGWMLYGAYGTTGRMILHEALRRGKRPILGGRDASQLTALASAAGLASRALALDDPGPAGKALAGIAVVLNAAGPFFRTGAPLRRLCLEAGVSYVDVNGEIGDFRAAIDCDAEAKAKSVAIVPGAGFGVVFGEALAAHVARRLPGATWMRLSLLPANAGTSRAAALSTASVLAGGGYAVSGGELLRRPIGFRSWRVARKGQFTPALRFGAAPCAELIAAQRLTGVPDIVIGVPMPLAASFLLRVAAPLVAKVISSAIVAGRSASPSGKSASTHLQSSVWAEAGNSHGEPIVSMLETGEGYRMAAVAAVRAVEEVLARRPVGALTPAQAFGPRFALSLPDTRIADL